MTSRCEPDVRRRRRLVLAACLAAAAAFVWRAPVDGYANFMLADPDSLYHLHRVETCLANYPAVRSIDAYSHHPFGYRNHWISLHTLFYATVAKALGLPPDERQGLVRALSWVPPLLGLASVGLAIAAATCYANGSAAIVVVGLTAAFSANGFWLFRHGAIDHHLFACLGIQCLVLARLKKRLWAWIGGCALLLAMTPAASLYVTIFAAVLVGAELAGCCAKAEPRLERTWLWLLSPGLACAMVLALHRAIETAPLPLAHLSCMHLSLFQPLWLACFGAAMGLLLFALRRLQPTRRTRELAVYAALGGVLAAVLGLALLWAAGQLGPMWERLAFTRRMPVSEEAGPLSVRFMQLPGWIKVLALAEVYLIGRLIVETRRRSDSDNVFRWLALTVGLGVGLLEFRHLRAVSPLAAIAVTVAAFESVRLLRRMPLFEGPRRGLAPIALIAVIAAPAFLHFSFGSRAGSVRRLRAQERQAGELADWLRLNTPSPGPRHGAAPAYGVFCEWNLGHHLNIVGERPVVVDPFNHMGVVEPSTAVWLSQTDEELVQALSSYRARYLVLTSPARNILTMLALERRDVSDLVRVAPELPGGFLFTSAMRRYAAFRLFAEAEAPTTQPGPLRLRFCSSLERALPVLGPDGKARIRVVPAARIYELSASAAQPAAEPAP